MIAPRTRLLIWTAVVLLPGSLLVAFEPAAAVLAWALLAALVAAAVADAVAGGRRFRGISAQLPPVARMSKDREGRLEMRLRRDLGRPLTLHVALELPKEIVAPYESVAVTLSGEAEWSRLDWLCVPQKRGKFKIGPVHIQVASPLGLWNWQRAVDVAGELRVYPNLARDRRDLAALFLHRGSFGFHARRQIGKGREFEKLREYSPGDSFDEVHWKATARRGHPITKVFQVERTQEVYAVLDASRLSARNVPEGVLKGPAWLDPRDTTHQATTLERFVTAALMLGLAAEQQGDFFGLVTFSDQVGRFIRARNGRAHYNTCRDALYTVEPRMVSPDYDELCTFLRLRLRRRALLIIMTALDDPVLAESFVRNLELIRGQHVILVNMLQPEGVAPLFSAADVNSVDDVYYRLGGHLQWHKLRELGKVLQRRGARFSLLKNERLSAQVTAQYLDVKRRQLL